VENIDKNIFHFSRSSLEKSIFKIINQMIFAQG
jgi:hypothetical protein